MKILFNRLIYFVLFIFSISICFALDPEYKSITVVTDNNYPPYIFYNKDNQLQGILIDHWKLWEQKTGIKVNIIATDWSKAQKIMESGKADVIDTIFFNEGRAKLYDFTKPYAKLEVPIFMHKYISGIATVEDLKGFQVAVKDGDACIDILKSHGIEHLLIYNNYESIVQDAANSKFRVFCIDKPPAMYYLYKYKVDSEYKYALNLYTGEFHRAVKKGNLKLLNLIENGFSKITKQEYSAIDRKWLGVPVALENIKLFLYVVLFITFIVLILLIWSLTLRKRVKQKTYELSKTLKELELSEKKNKSIIELIPDLLFITDKNGYFIYYKNNSDNQLYVSSDKIIGSSFYEMNFPGPFISQVDYYSKLAKQNNSTETFDYQLQINDKLFSYEARVIPYGNNETLWICRDVTEKKEKETVIIENEQKYKSIIEYNYNGILLVNEKGIITEWNKAIEKITNIPKEYAIGKSAVDIQFSLLKAENRTKEYFESIKYQLEKLLSSSNSENFYREQSYKIFDKNNTEKDISSIIFPIFSQGKVQLCNIIIDMSEQKKYQSELLSAKEKAEAANITKSQFLANMSHEIRTPLNGIVGTAQLLSLTPLTGEQKKYLEILEFSCDSLLHVINDILDLSKLEAGKINFINLPFKVETFIENITSLFTPAAEKKRLKLKTYVQSGIPIVKGDIERIKQVLMNLLNNAIKFTPEGAISLEVLKKAESESTITLSFHVIDTGIGIENDKLDLIFQKFYQIDYSSTRRYGGTGLGLAISQEIVKLMGNEIKVESESNKGSHFYFELTFQKEGENMEDLKNENSISASPQKRSILLVEDNQVNQETTRLMLNKLGFTTIIADNGKKAVELFISEKPDLILMDIEMPEMSGLDATRKIRALPNGKDIPIIALTAYALKGDRERCIEAGMDDYMAKPYKYYELQDIIKLHLLEF